MSVTQIVDTDLNALASDRQIDLETDLSDAHSILIAVATPPTGTVPVTVSAASAVTTLTSSQAVTAYVFTAAGDAGDGSDDFEALPATVDPSAGTILIALGGQYFQPASDGTFYALLKIGVASASTSAASISAESHTPTVIEYLAARQGTSTSTSGALPCPVPSVTCTERSRFNPQRYLRGVFRPHYGVDLSAPVGTAIIVPANGTPEPKSSFTVKQYNSGAKRCPTSSCNGSAGITLSLTYGTYRIRLLHLSAIDSSILNADGTINTAAVTSAENPVASTGNTGAAQISGAHLHYEIFSGTTKVCGTSNTQCQYVHNRTDPFPLMVANFTLAESSNNHTLNNGAAYQFTVTATDSSGIAVTSAVGNPAENGGRPPAGGNAAAAFAYDPTRKVCSSSSESGVLEFPTPDSSTTFSGIAIPPSASPSYCEPWPGTGNGLSATGLANNPTTTVTTKFSADPTAETATDPLSTIAGTWQLGPTTTVLKLTAPSNPLVVTHSENLAVSAEDLQGDPETSPANLQWTTSDPTLATVIGGTVTGISLGNVIIKVTDPASGASATISLQITLPEIQNVPGLTIPETGAFHTTVSGCNDPTRDVTITEPINSTMYTAPPLYSTQLAQLPDSFTWQGVPGLNGVLTNPYTYAHTQGTFTENYSLSLTGGVITEELRYIYAATVYSDYDVAPGGQDVGNYKSIYDISSGMEQVSYTFTRTMTGTGRPSSLDAGCTVNISGGYSATGTVTYPTVQ